MSSGRDPITIGDGIHKMRLPPGLTKASRQRRADRMGEKLARKGFRVVNYQDGGLLGNSYLYVEGEDPGPLDLYGILERFATALILLAVVYYFYTRFIDRS